MNREIKFRGKSVKNGKWICGYLGEARGRILQSTYREKVIFENLEWFNTDNFGYVVNDYMVDEETIGQFTGLTDKNGKEAVVKEQCEYKNGIKYRLDIDYEYWWWTDEMFEGLVSEENTTDQLIKDIAKVINKILLSDKKIIEDIKIGLTSLARSAHFC